MRKFVITVAGDNDQLHAEMLDQIIELIEGKGGGYRGSVYRAWIEPVTDPRHAVPPVTRIVK